VHTLNVKLREDGFVFDKLYLTLATDVPMGTGPALSSLASHRWFQDGDLVVMQAENATARAAGSGDAWALEANQSASGEAELRALPDDGTAFAIASDAQGSAARLDFDVVFKKEGRYNVWVRGHSDPVAPAGSDSVYVGLDAGMPAGINGFSTTLGWRQTMYGTPAQVTVSSLGKHTLSVYVREDGFAIDKILLAHVAADYAPSGEGPGETVVDASGTLPGTVQGCENNVCDAGETPETCPWDCQPTDIVQQKPNWRVRYEENGTSTLGPVYQLGAGAGPFAIDNDIVTGTVADDGDGYWSLTLTAKKKLVNVAFPWLTTSESTFVPLNGTAEDDLVYTPGFVGRIETETTRDSWAWGVWRYPGQGDPTPLAQAFAPLIVNADADYAQVLAAVNWPPRPARILHARQQYQVLFDEPLEIGQTRTLRILLKKVRGSGTYAPWILATERYRKWLAPRQRRWTQPRWVDEGEGFIYYGLMNRTVPPTAASISGMFSDAQVKQYFPWVQFWGQMSNYAGVPDPYTNGGPTGCCLLEPTVHPRYEGVSYGSSVGQDLRPLLRETLPAMGVHWGFYSRPSEQDLSADPGQSYLRDWVEYNRNYGSDAFYLDIVGRKGMGDLKTVADYLETLRHAHEGIVSEGLIDIYPVAGLLDGTVSASGGLEFSRVALGPRTDFFGFLNTTGVLFGENNGYAGERLGFLHGTKQIPNAGNVNAMHRAIAEVRASVNWWARRPRYVHTAGLGVPSDGSIQVRRFIGADGVSLLAVDNPQMIANATIAVKGVTVPLSSSPVSCVLVP
jgi:hypothetical protein